MVAARERESRGREERGIGEEQLLYSCLRSEWLHDPYIYSPYGTFFFHTGKPNFITAATKLQNSFCDRLTTRQKPEFSLSNI